MFICRTRYRLTPAKPLRPISCTNVRPSVFLQSDAAAAKSKAEATAATWAQVSVQREQLRVELEKAALTAERNVLLQGLVLSESERRKKVPLLLRSSSSPFYVAVADVCFVVVVVVVVVVAAVVLIVVGRFFLLPLHQHGSFH